MPVAERIRKINRRWLLRTTATLASAGALAACTPATPTPMVEIPKPGQNDLSTKAAEAPKAAQAVEKPAAPVLLRNLQTEAERNAEKEARYKAIHALRVGNIPPPLTPYYKGLFRQEELKKSGTTLVIPEGWEYSLQEFLIHGSSTHSGVDVAAPGDTKLYNPYSFDEKALENAGYKNIKELKDVFYAGASYDARWIIEQGKPKTYKGPKGDEEEAVIQSSLGLFVWVYSPLIDRILRVAHLSKISDKIRYSQPLYNQSTDVFTATGISLNLEQRGSLAALDKNPALVRIGPGDYLGSIGNSGLMWGKRIEVRPDQKSAPEIDPKLGRTWDEEHVHVEDTTRDIDGNLAGRRDVLAEYGVAEDYKLDGTKRYRDTCLFYKDSKGVPLLAA